MRVVIVVLVVGVDCSERRLAGAELGTYFQQVSVGLLTWRRECQQPLLEDRSIDIVFI